MSGILPSFVVGIVVSLGLRKISFLSSCSWYGFSVRSLRFWYFSSHIRSFAPSNCKGGMVEQTPRTDSFKVLQHFLADEPQVSYSKNFALYLVREIPYQTLASRWDSLYIIMSSWAHPAMRSCLRDSEIWFFNEC